MPARPSDSASSETEKATARGRSVSSAAAVRARRMPVRAMSIQWRRPLFASPEPSVSVSTDHVSVEMTSQPAATYARWTSRTVSGAR